MISMIELVVVLPYVEEHETVLAREYRNCRVRTLFLP